MHKNETGKKRKQFFSKDNAILFIGIAGTVLFICFYKEIVTLFLKLVLVIS